MSAKTEQFGSRGLSGVDEIADVGIAGRDDAVERSDHPFEGLEVLEPRDVLLGRIHRGLLGGGIGRAIVRVLFGDRLGLEQSLPALVGDDGYREVRLCRRQIRARLRQLLVDLRGLDFRQEIALVDPGADVGAPALEVAAGSRVDRRFDVGLHDAGQDQFVSGPAQLRLRRDDGRDGVLQRRLAQFGARRKAADDAPRGESRGKDADDEGVAAYSASELLAPARDPWADADCAGRDGPVRRPIRVKGHPDQP